MSNKLGLPFEYQQMPDYFYAHNVGADVEARNVPIENY